MASLAEDEETGGNVAGRYRHILVLQGCYDITKDDRQEEEEEQEELQDRRSKGRPNKCARMYPASVKCIKQSEHLNTKVPRKATFYAKELSETVCTQTVEEFIKEKVQKNKNLDF